MSFCEKAGKHCILARNRFRKGRRRLLGMAARLFSDLRVRLQPQPGFDVPPDLAGYGDERLGAFRRCPHCYYSSLGVWREWMRYPALRSPVRPHWIASAGLAPEPPSPPPARSWPLRFALFPPPKLSCWVAADTRRWPQYSDISCTLARPVNISTVQGRPISLRSRIFSAAEQSRAGDRAGQSRAEQSRPAPRDEENEVGAYFVLPTTPTTGARSHCRLFHWSRCDGESNCDSPPDRRNRKLSCEPAVENGN